MSRWRVILEEHTTVLKSIWSIVDVVTFVVCKWSQGQFLFGLDIYSVHIIFMLVDLLEDNNHICKPQQHMWNACPYLDMGSNNVTRVFSTKAYAWEQEWEPQYHFVQPILEHLATTHLSNYCGLEISKVGMLGTCLERLRPFWRDHFMATYKSIFAKNCLSQITFWSKLPITGWDWCRNVEKGCKRQSLNRRFQPKIMLMKEVVGHCNLQSIYYSIRWLPLLPFRCACCCGRTQPTRPSTWPADPPQQQATERFQDMPHR